MTSPAQRSSKLKSQIREALMLLAAADPVLKVRKLIQDPIEKCVTEAWLTSAVEACTARLDARPRPVSRAAGAAGLEGCTVAA